MLIAETYYFSWRYAPNPASTPLFAPAQLPSKPPPSGHPKLCPAYSTHRAPATTQLLTTYSELPTQPPPTHCKGQPSQVRALLAGWMLFSYGTFPAPLGGRHTLIAGSGAGRARAHAPGPDPISTERDS